MIMTVLVCTGVWISEALGIESSAIDFDRGVIKIVQKSYGKNVGETKSESSHVEDYPMHQFLAAELQNWKESSEPVNGWVFGSMLTGHPFHGSTMCADP
jgi:hypothetical protein